MNELNLLVAGIAQRFASEILFLDPHPLRVPEVPTIQMGKEIVSVHMSSFRTSLSSESVHEDPSASGGFITQQRHSLCHLSGRHSPSGSG